MGKVSKWEVGGVPAALVFGALYELGWLNELGVTAEDVPRLMVVAFVALATLRSAGQWFQGRKKQSGPTDT